MESTKFRLNRSAYYNTWTDSLVQRFADQQVQKAIKNIYEHTFLETISHDWIGFKQMLSEPLYKIKDSVKTDPDIALLKHSFDQHLPLSEWKDVNRNLLEKIN